MTNLSAPRFTNPDKAREHLEALHWPEGPFCPHCGSFNAKRLPDQHGRPTKAHPEGAVRKGLVQCNDCRQQYTVTVGTVFESSKVPLNKWLLANHLLCASKKGISSHQLSRMLGVTYKTAWFMSHRIREAMKSNDPGQFGEGGGMVEVDETYIGREPGMEVKQGGHHKMKVLALVDRETGRSRAVMVESTRPAEIAPILYHNIARDAQLMTDEAHHYNAFSLRFGGHKTVNHRSGEYVNADNVEIHTNTIEGYFSIFKRGMRGIYQHCGKPHLNRYLTEFDFRYTNRIANGVDDDQRAEIALKGAVGRRLTYRRSSLVAA